MILTVLFKELCRGKFKFMSYMLLVWDSQNWRGETPHTHSSTYS